MKISETIKKSASKNDLYKFFEGNSFWESANIELKPNYWNGKPSNWSLSFKGHCLKDIFDIKDPIFCTKFCQAISGDGHEGSRITTLHSSSLLSLLVFYSVSEKNPIYFRIEGKKIKFTKSEFEVKNEVNEGSNNYSNIDVVLSGEDSTLYLESKFSEYLNTGNKEVRKTDYYREIYSRLSNSLGNAQVELDMNKWLLCKKKGEKALYCEGIKQMVSHYLGIDTEIKKGKRDEMKGKQVFLGEIIFDFSDKVKGSKEKQKSYEEAYKCLKEGLEICAAEDKNGLKITDLMTYQELLKLDENKLFLNNLPERIRWYYQL